MELEVELSQASPDEVVVSLAGSLDLTSRDQFIAAASEALSDPVVQRFVLELAGLSFMDSTGIGAIVQVAGLADDREVAFSLRSPSERIMRVLQLTGMDELWRIETAPTGPQT